MSSAPEKAVLTTRRFHSARRIRRNFPLMFIDALGWPLGWTIMSPDTILPAFLMNLSDSPLVVALLRVVYAVGLWLPILWAPNLISRVRRRGKFVTVVGMIERAPMLVLGLTAPLLAGANPSGMLLVFFLCWSVRAIGEGVNLSAYASLLDEGVPETHRGRLWGMSTGISAVLALPVGYWSARHLAAHPFPTGYATLFIVGFVVLAVTLVPLWWVRESREGRLKPAETRSGLASLRMLREDWTFRRYTLTVAAIALSEVALPFYSVHAIRTFGMPDSSMGLLAGAQAAAASVGSILLGFVSDRIGFRGPLMLALGLGLAAPLTAFVAPAAWAMYPTFAFLGAGLATIVMCRYNMLLELAPLGRLGPYTGVFYSVVQPVFAVAPFIGSFLVEYGGVRSVFLPSIAALIAAMVLLRGVREPRGRGSDAGPRWEGTGGADASV